MANTAIERKSGANPACKSVRPNSVDSAMLSAVARIIATTHGRTPDKKALTGAYFIRFFSADAIKRIIKNDGNTTPSVPWSSTSLRVLFKLLLLPVVMGISYELLKWCGRSDNIATRIIRQPGIWVQHLTVFEPDDSMIEVAIAAVTPVLPEDPEDGRW